MSRGFLLNFISEPRGWPVAYVAVHHSPSTERVPPGTALNRDLVGTGRSRPTYWAPSSNPYALADTRFVQSR